ncbi:MAG: hypothetical protein AAGA56_04090 [Myxococcota bacterium]
MKRLLLILQLVLLATVFTACNRSYRVGDEVMVEWEEGVYPAVITEIPKPGLVKVHYIDYDEIWDEEIPKSRIKGPLLEKPDPPPEAPLKVRRTAVEAAKTNDFKVGDRVKVDWHNHFYSAVIIGVVGPERYRVHYEGYGSEWDENVGRDRIKGR